MSDCAGYFYSLKSAILALLSIVWYLFPLQQLLTLFLLGFSPHCASVSFPCSLSCPVDSLMVSHWFVLTRAVMILCKMSFLHLYGWLILLGPDCQNIWAFVTKFLIGLGSWVISGQFVILAYAAYEVVMLFSAHEVIVCLAPAVESIFLALVAESIFWPLQPSQFFGPCDSMWFLITLRA